ncbi:MAG: aquaporin, partial [Actinomycetota bacterium]
MEGSLESIGKAAVAEFVATFTLVSVVAGSLILNANGQLDLTGVALAHGLVLAIMISVTAHISGGLVNPAVAIALWATGRLTTFRAGILIVAELAGAVTGAYLLRFLLPPELFDAGGGGITALGDGITVGKGILIEA